MKLVFVGTVDYWRFERLRSSRFLSNSLRLEFLNNLADYHVITNSRAFYNLDISLKKL